MRFHTKQHKFYCGIDLHAKKMYLCILDETGEVRLHQNIKTDREVFLKVIEPFREGMVVAVECMFTWYWIAALCNDHEIPFVLGHALYMKAIHGGKAKNGLGRGRPPMHSSNIGIKFLVTPPRLREATFLVWDVRNPERVLIIGN